MELLPKKTQRNSYPLRAVLWGVMFAGQSFGQPDRDPPQAEDRHEERVGERVTWALQDAERAIAQARKLLGRRSDPKVRTPNARLRTLKQDNTPYLHSVLVGNPVWHVVVEEWSIELKSALPDARDGYARTLDIYLDPKQGHVLKMRTRWPEGEPPISAEPTAAQAEDQFRRASNEKYHGFPKEPPRVTLAEALDSMYRSGVDVFAAKQIVVQCVIRSTDYDEPKPVWAITLRGVSPFRRRLPTWPKGDVYEYRYIVDAETGTYELMTNIPWSHSWDPVSPEGNDDD